MPIEPQISPPRTYILRGATAGCAVLAAMAAGALAMTPPKSAAVESGDFAFVFRADGASWLRIASVDPEAPLPAHGAPRLIERDGAPTAAVAPLADELLPASLSDWAERRVLVDGECLATVTGFAIIARLEGDPAYAGDGGERWTAASTFAHGHKVYAARLDRCTGSWARLADRSPAVKPIEVDAPAALATARTDLLGSPPASRLSEDWRAAGMTGSWQQDPNASITGAVVRHPVTGVTWVIVHARLDGSCGDPAASFAGLYRVDEGVVQRAALIEDLDLVRIDQLIDVDGDGRFEMLGSAGLGLDTALVRADGNTIDMLDVPFYGCPC